MWAVIHSSLPLRSYKSINTWNQTLTIAECYYSNQLTGKLLMDFPFYGAPSVRWSQLPNAVSLQRSSGREQIEPGRKRQTDRERQHRSDNRCMAALESWRHELQNRNRNRNQDQDCCLEDYAYLMLKADETRRFQNKLTDPKGGRNKLM